MVLTTSSKPILALPLEIVFWTQDRYKIKTSIQLAFLENLYPHLHSLISNKDMYNGLAQSSLRSWQTLLLLSRRKTRLQCADMLWSSDLTWQVTDWHIQLNLLNLAQHSTRLQQQPCDICEIPKLCSRLTQTLACTLSRLWKTCNIAMTLSTTLISSINKPTVLVMQTSCFRQNGTPAKF